LDFKIVVIARLAQSVERQTLNLVVAGSSPAVGCSQKERLIFLFSFFMISVAFDLRSDTSKFILFCLDLRVRNFVRDLDV
jgi:hypothetical protein